MATLTPEQTAKGLSLAIQHLNTLIAAKVQYGEHLRGPTLAAARTNAERATTQSMIESNVLEVKHLRDLADGLRVLREGQA